MDIYKLSDKIGEALNTFKAELGKELMDEVAEVITKHKNEENDLLVSSIMQEVLATIDEKLNVTKKEIE